MAILAALVARLASSVERSTIGSCAITGDYTWLAPPLLRVSTNLLCPSFPQA